MTNRKKMMSGLTALFIFSYFQNLFCFSQTPQTPSYSLLLNLFSPTLFLKMQKKSYTHTHSNKHTHSLYFTSPLFQTYEQVNNFHIFYLVSTSSSLQKKMIMHLIFSYAWKSIVSLFLCDIFKALSRNL